MSSLEAVAAPGVTLEGAVPDFSEPGVVELEFELELFVFSVVAQPNMRTAQTRDTIKRRVRDIVGSFRIKLAGIEKRQKSYTPQWKFDSLSGPW